MRARTCGRTLFLRRRPHQLHRSAGQGDRDSTREESTASCRRTCRAWVPGTPRAICARPVIARRSYFFSRSTERCEQLLRQNPRCVAITTTFYVDPQPIREIVRFVRAVKPDIPVLVGGLYIYNAWNATPRSRSCSKHCCTIWGQALAIVDSQGELSLARAISYLRGESRANETVVMPAARGTRSNSLVLPGRWRSRSGRTTWCHSKSARPS